MIHETEQNLIPGNTFEVVRVTNLYGTNKLFVTIRFRLPNFRDQEITLPVSEVKSSKLDKHIPEAFAMEGVKISSQSTMIRQGVNDCLCHANIETLLPQGYSYIGGKWVYVLGGCVINPGIMVLYPYNPMNSHMDADVMSTDSKEWIKWVKMACTQSPSHAALFLCALTPFIRPVIELLNISKVANAFVVGASGNGKSSFCRLFTQLFDNAFHGVNLTTDKSKMMEMLAGFSDRAFMVDDLNKSSSVRETESKLQKLSTLIQTSSSEGEILSNGIPVNIDRTALIITGEYLPESASTINRCVVIRFDEAFDSSALDWLQKNRYLFDAFLLQFVNWVCKKAASLSEEIEKRLHSGYFDYSNAHSDVSNYVGFQRIINSYKLLRITEYLLVRFCFEQRATTRPDKLSQTLQDGISSAIGNTLDCVKVSRNTSNLLDCFLEVFRCDPDNVVASSAKKYFQSKNKVFFRFEKTYFFKGEQLAAYLSSKANTDITAKRISRELIKAGLLVSYGGELSSRLPKRLGVKDKGRYYRLSASALVDLVSSNYPDYFDHIQSPLPELSPYDKD